MRRYGRVVVVALLLVGGCAADPVVDPEAAAPSASESATTEPSAPTSPPEPKPPLAGRTIVVDAGHQLGNRNFPTEINRQVPAGGFRKPCNTTGTATDAGYPEATMTWRVARSVVRRLEGLGARVISTRHSNSERKWGPCVDVRGRAGNKAGADLKLSIHGDGSYAADAHGFHVIAPTDRRPWTHDIFTSSRRFAKLVRASLKESGVPYATYVAGGDGLDLRSDLATLNLSDVPAVVVELGNMRDTRDARRMTSAKGQRAYAAALVRAVRRALR